MVNKGLALLVVIWLLIVILALQPYQARVCEDANTLNVPEFEDDPRLLQWYIDRYDYVTPPIVRADCSIESAYLFLNERQQVIAQLPKWTNQEGVGLG